MNTQYSRSFRFGNHTDIGKVRSQNEDYLGFFENENGSFFIVCDGMGGHVGGAIASQTAVNSIRVFFEKQYYENPHEAIYQAILAANQDIYQKAQFNMELSGMGTTCVVLLIRNGKIYYGHVGDSRLYRFALDKVQRLTKDHSFVQALIDQEIITEEEAEKHPRRHELLRALGTSSFVDVDVCREPIIPHQGDMFLLCTDGLTGLVSDAGIEEILHARNDIQRKAMKLVDLANTLGGNDNITVQLIEFLQNPDWEGMDEKGNKKTSLPESTYHTQAMPWNQVQKKKNTIGNHYTQTDVDDIHTENSHMVSINNTEINYRPYLIKGFVTLIAVVGIYFVYQNTLGNLKIIGSGNYKTDSLRAIALENQLYQFFWDSNPKLKKVKDSVEGTYTEAKRTVQEIREYKKRALRAVDSLFKNKQVAYVANNIQKNKETLHNLARKYGSNITWILKANGVSSEEELKKLDTLAIPLEAPAIPSQDSLR